MTFLIEQLCVLPHLTGIQSTLKENTFRNRTDLLPTVTLLAKEPEACLVLFYFFSLNNGGWACFNTHMVNQLIALNPSKGYVWRRIHYL